MENNQSVDTSFRNNKSTIEDIKSNDVFSAEEYEKTLLLGKNRPNIYISSGKDDASSVSKFNAASILKEVSVKESKSKINGSFQVIQKWIGFVENVQEEFFIARLNDLTNRGTDEIVEIRKEDISPEDLQLIVKGGTFFWSIGRAKQRDGQITNQSLIRFRRIPFDMEKFDDSIDAIKDIGKGLKWE